MKTGRGMVEVWWGHPDKIGVPPTEMATDAARELFSLRKQLPEPVFGIIKEQMRFRRFLTRGWSNVKAEATLTATAFNLRTLHKAWNRQNAINIAS